MNSVATHVGQGGRVVIPAEYRKMLGLGTGDEVILVLEDREVRLMTPAKAIERAQAIVRSHVPKGRSLSEELIKERREEAARG